MGRAMHSELIPLRSRKREKPSSSPSTPDTIHAHGRLILTPTETIYQHMAPAVDGTKGKPPRSPTLTIEREPLKPRVVDPPAPSITRSLAVCLLYGTTSVSITFFNKAIFSVYAFRFPCFVTLLQIVVGLAILSVAIATGYIQSPPFSRELVRTVYPLSICWWVYVVSGISALRYLNIPMFSTLRKATAFIVLVLETLVLHKTARGSIWLSILIMVAGGFIAGLTDLSFSLTGYVLVGVCCFSTALYLILIVKIGKRSGLDTFGLLFYNNMLSFPLMLGYLVFFTDELSEVPKYEYIEDTRFWGFLLFSAALATLLNFAIFLCTKLNSPLATTVTGQMKDFVTIGFGLFVFGDVTLNTPNLVGLGISLVGSLMYSVIKLLAARQQQVIASTGHGDK